MFKKPTKKQMLVRRILLSILATVSVIIIVTASILFMLGFRFDNSNWQLEQGALLQFDSAPNGAQVWINGGYIGSNTATKQTVVAGVHAIKFTREGYEDWNRTLNLEAGTLTWLDYILLVPKNRLVEEVINYKNLASMDFSPDRKWALAHQETSLPRFELVDLRSEQVTSSTLTLNQSLYSGATNANTKHQFTVHQWSTGGRYVLIKHQYNNSTEWLLVDTEDIARSVNINRSLSVALSDVKFASTSGMGLYGLTTDKVVRKLDLSGGTLSRGLITNVQQFSVFEESSVVSYVGTDPDDDTKTVVGTYKDGDSSAHVIRTISERNIPVRIAVGKYFNDDYVAIAEDMKVTILRGSLPSGTTKDDTLRQFATFDLAAPVTNLSFSPKSAYVLAQSDAVFTSYELEHRRASNGAIDASQVDTVPALKWLDIAHVWSNTTKSVIMRDFDGTNAHSIMPALPGYDASLSQNGRFFYAVGEAEDGGVQLQRIRMII